MKKQFAVFAAIAFASVSLIHAQDAAAPDAAAIPESSEQEAAQSDEGVLIEEPAGAEPDFDVAPATPDYQAVPTDLTGDTTESEPKTTITISQTFTNEPNAIAIVGKVSSAEEKESVEQALQEALPGREINNHLTVSTEEITEPAGAERELEHEEVDDVPEVDVEREFELQDQQDNTQAEP